MKKRLILNEKKFVEEQLLVNGLSDYLYLGDIKLLIKYWRYYGVNDKKDLLLLLSNYLKKFYPNEFESINRLFPTTEELIYKIIGETKNQKLKIPVCVPLTENELNFCHSAKNHRLEKILFSMIVLSKYSQLTKSKPKKEYVPDPDKTYDEPYYRRVYTSEHFIFKYAETKQKSNEYLFYELRLLGLIESRFEHSKYDNSGQAWIELKIDNFDNSPIKLIIDDIENLSSFYPFFCEDCNSIIEKTGSRKKICGDCRKIRERERVKLAMRKRRIQGVLANVTQ